MHNFSHYLSSAGGIISAISESLYWLESLFMWRWPEPFPLMMISQTKADRSHPHEIIFESRLSRVELEQQPVGPRIALKLKVSDMLQSKVTEFRSVSAWISPRTIEIWQNQHFKNFSIIYRFFGRESFPLFVSGVAKKLTTHSVKYCRVHKNHRRNYTKLLLRARSATSARWTGGKKDFRANLNFLCMHTD